MSAFGLAADPVAGWWHSARSPSRKWCPVLAATMPARPRSARQTPAMLSNSATRDTAPGP